jgi:hypothetical protein
MLEYANSKGNTNPHLVLESAWRVPNWALMKDALSQVYTCSLGHRELWFFLSIIYKYGVGCYYFFLYHENTVRYIELYCFFAVIRICIQSIIWYFCVDFIMASHGDYVYNVFIYIVIILSSMRKSYIHFMIIELLIYQSSLEQMNLNFYIL